MRRLLISLIVVGVLVSVGCSDKKEAARRKQHGDKLLREWKQEQKEQLEWEREVERLRRKLKQEREERMRKRG